MLLPLAKSPPRQPFVLICLLALLLTAPGGVSASKPIPTGPSCRILDIHTTEHQGRIFRLVLRFSAIPERQIERPLPGKPLRIRLENTVPALATPFLFQSNRLIRGVRVEEESGDTVLEVELSAPEVKIHSMELPSENLVLVDIEPLPGVNLPEFETAKTTEMLAQPEKEPLHLSPIIPSSAQHSESPEPGSELASLSDEETTEVLTESELPQQDWILQFPNAGAMREAFEDEDYLLAHSIGIDALDLPQSGPALESLLFLLAECQYNLQESREGPTALRPPDWPTALNYYQQAIRFSPDSNFRPAWDHRIAQIYAKMGRFQEKLAQLQELAKQKDHPSRANILLETGNAALLLNSSSPPGSTCYLEEAKEAFTQYLREHPEEAEGSLATLLLGEAFYRQGNDEKAYDLILAFSLKKKRIADYPEVYEHFALAAHRLGELNLVAPRTANDRHFARRLGSSLSPENRLAYARLLVAGGNTREALRQYHAVCNYLAHAASERQIFDAKFAMTQLALEDMRRGARLPGINFVAYADPLTTLKELYQKSFNVGQRTRLLDAMVKYLIAQGREVEAVRLALPYLRKGRLPSQLTHDLSKTVWDAMPQAMRYVKEQGDYLFALNIYESFGELLDQHPLKNDLVLECVRILLDARLPDHAQEALKRLGPNTELNPSQHALLDTIQRELRLDPTRPEHLKKEAQDLLTPENDESVRARVARLLAKVYEDEEDYMQAGRTYLQGALLENLKWREKADFWLSAAEAYRKAPHYSKSAEVAWKGIWDF
ncbi:hypothetical protein HQ520_18575, partial [bacterium]|nr:hypothetical protein [bacterium]